MPQRNIFHIISVLNYDFLSRCSCNFFHDGTLFNENVVTKGTQNLWTRNNQSGMADLAKEKGKTTSGSHPYTLASSTAGRYSSGILHVQSERLYMLHNSTCIALVVIACPGYFKTQNICMPIISSYLGAVSIKRQDANSHHMTHGAFGLNPYIILNFVCYISVLPFRVLRV